MKPLTVLLSALTASLLLPGCGDSDPKASNNSGGGHEETDAALQALLLDTAPTGALTITEARKNPTPGTEVVFSGKVMGREEPIVETRALVLLGDPNKLVSCDLNPDDPCEKPWDVCCETPEAIKAGVATIRVLDENGKVLKHGLRGLGGMKELSSLIVKGTVAEGSNADNFVVDVTGIHVAMAEPTKENPAERSASEAP